jgi:salicylate hydroxylase
VRGDLVIAADGVHSGAVEAVLGFPSPALPTPSLAYRFLIPSHKITSDIKTAHFYDSDDASMKFLIGDDHRLIWYPCRNNELQNFNAISHTDEMLAEKDWQSKVDKSLLLKRFADFHPSLLAVMEQATEITQWPLLYRTPIPSWHKGKLVLIGDAAHPMLPRKSFLLHRCIFL